MLRNTNTIPAPKGTEQIIGAIQWIRAGEAVHANEKRPYTGREVSGGKWDKDRGTYDWQENTTNDRGW